MGGAVRETRSGELLNQAYELHEVVESDAVHDTYRATDRKRARAVKVKLLRPEFALQSNVVQRFLRAPRSLTGLRHPNVSQVLSVESDETGIPFVVEEHVEGEPLARTIARFPQGMPLASALELLLPVAEALSAAHELGVVHGRLDRDQVVLERAGGAARPKLVRFGALDSGRERGGGSDRLAPELRDGKTLPDARSDVWALGALLHEALCGERPRPSAAAGPLEKRAQLPAELTQIIKRCLAPKPADRPARVLLVRDVLLQLRERAPDAEAKTAVRGDAKGAVRRVEAKPAPARAEAKAAPLRAQAKAAPQRDDPPTVPRMDVKTAPPPRDPRAEPRPEAGRPRGRAGVGRNTALGRNVPLPALETSADPLAATAPGDFARAATDPDLARSGTPGADDDSALDLSFGATFGDDAPPPVPPQPARKEKPARRGDPVRPAEEDPALSATIAARRVDPKSAELAEFPIADAFEMASEPEEPVLEISVDADDAGDGDEGPEITLEAAPSLAPRAAQASDPPAMEIKTLSDVAAAFGPIEGADRVGQADAPSIKRIDDDDPGPARKTRAGRARAAAKPEHDEEKEKDRDNAGVVLLPSPKQLKQGVMAAQPRALSEEQMRALRERTQQSERRTGRIVSTLLFLLFAFLLVFATPLLVDPTHTRAQQLLGTRTKLAVSAFTVLTVIALVRTWALQIKARPAMLRPVTITLKVVTGLVCVLSATFFLPAGALGPAEPAARSVLPWAVSGFYMFLALYGMVMGMREASSNALSGLSMAVLYMAGFFGSYRVLATTVLVKKDKAALVAGAAHQGGPGQVGVSDMAGYVAGNLAGELKADAGADDKPVERNQVGASEAEDMRAIEQLEDSRKRKSSQFEQLGDKMNEVIH